MKKQLNKMLNELYEKVMKNRSQEEILGEIKKIQKHIELWS